jgi:hypothetical protein
MLALVVNYIQNFTGHAAVAWPRRKKTLAKAV